MESESLLVGAETKQENAVQNNSRTKFREIVRYVLGYAPVVKEIKLISSNLGLISFEVPIESMGLDLSTLKKYNAEIFTNRFANLIGEVILRENLTPFVDEMIKMGVSGYQEALTRNHQNFGLRVKGASFIFDFHVSLLQDIVMSDFKGQVK